MHQIPTTHTQKRADHGCLLQNQFNKLLYVIMHFCTLIALKIRDWFPQFLQPAAQIFHILAKGEAAAGGRFSRPGQFFMSHIS